MIPRELDLCVTNTCNMNCGYCYARGKNMGKLSLSLEEMKKAVLAYLREVLSGNRSVDKISISGGEPLTRWKEVSAFIKWLRKKLPGGIIIEIFTNGLLLDREKAQFILRNGLKLRLSIDGKKRDHDAARRSGPGSSPFDAVMKNLESMPKKLRRRIETVPVITSENAPRLYENMKFLADAGFKITHPSFVLDEIWPERLFPVLKRELKKTAALLGNEKYKKRLVKIYLKDLSGELEEFAKGNEISVATDGCFYPSSLVSASAAAKDAAFRRKFRVGSIKTGINVRKFRALRKEAYEAVVKTGAKLYLGCLLCMYYSVKVNGGNLKKLLLNAEKIARLTAESGMGKIGP